MSNDEKLQNVHAETASTENMPEEAPGETQSVQPGIESEMSLTPVVIRDDYRGSDKLKGKVALITGGDSGIGRAVAVHFAREGADVAILYLNEEQDAQETLAMVQEEGRRGVLIAGDIGDVEFCKQAVQQTVKELGGLDILVNNAAEQHPQDSISDITPEQLERTFRTNIFAMFYLTQAAMPHLKPGSTIINTTSVTAYKGSPQLLDYSSTKGAIVAFTRSLSQNLAEQGIRVNAVAPGPIWTPLIPATFDAERVAAHGQSTPLKRPGQPAEVAPSFVFLASDDSSYISGQVLHPNGGEVVNG
ncbi:SDR family oxidoreductase [Deinococcus deserti]|uniref:Putative short-chain dehydrogenase n=1 Tax=Deinococcus deserti (strain DSM 17065 / CIP 109153 / LMG 22923 / VCD115) TaxID=546414 RepID=C1D3B0_DEIDV|nr:SDR family oxidoreductase [Deinococcus deserti]ACO47899.1 putative short-chain dehydrogenase [Deinococcus deserti VCD115]